VREKEKERESEQREEIERENSFISTFLSQPFVTVRGFGTILYLGESVFIIL
jgi:hypothetical protein